MVSLQRKTKMALLIVSFLALQYFQSLLRDSNPSLHIYSKVNARTVIGIPSVERVGQFYLINTLEDLFRDQRALSGDYIFLVMLSYSNHTYRSHITSLMHSKFTKEFESGVLQVFFPTSDHFKKLETFPFGKSSIHNYYSWRARQNLDYSYLLNYVYHHFSFIYYLQLEDDITVTSSYVQKMEEFINSTLPDSNWSMISFCNLGFIGKLFKKSDLPFLESMLRGFYKTIPCDWILELFILGRTGDCRVKDFLLAPRKGGCLKEKIPGIHHSLFQHKGDISSLKNKEQKLKDKSFILK